MDLCQNSDGTSVSTVSKKTLLTEELIGAYSILFYQICLLEIKFFSFLSYHILVASVQTIFVEILLELAANQ